MALDRIYLREVRMHAIKDTYFLFTSAAPGFVTFARTGIRKAVEVSPSQGQLAIQGIPSGICDSTRYTPSHFILQWLLL